MRKLSTHHISQRCDQQRSRTRRTRRMRSAAWFLWLFAAFFVWQLVRPAALATAPHRIEGPWQPYSGRREQNPDPARSCIKRTLKINCTPPRCEYIFVCPGMCVRTKPQEHDSVQEPPQQAQPRHEYQSGRMVRLL